MFWIIVLLQNPSSHQLEVTNRWPDIVLQDFLVDSRIHGSIYHSKSSSPEAAKQPQTITLPATITVVFSEMLCYFYARCNGTHTFQKFNFCLVSPQSIFPKVLGIIKMFSGKLRRVFMFFCLAAVFVWNSAMQAILPSLFLMVESWTLTLTEACEACSSFRCCCGSLWPLDESSLRSWGNFGRPATPGKVHHCSCFRHLWIMALTVVRWSPKV